MVVKVLFTGGVRLQRIECVDIVVGTAGELRLFEKDETGVRVNLLVAPGQWRYADIDRGER